MDLFIMSLIESRWLSLHPWLLSKISQFWINDLSWIMLCGLMCLICLAWFYLLRPSDKLPPGPFSLPLLGNLHNILGRLPHQVLYSLSQKYGPLMYLKLGSRHALFISNGFLAKNFLQSNDKYFASRPCLQFCKSLLYGHDSGIAFSVYGPRWRRMRRICTLELFTARRIKSFEKIMEDEIDLIIRKLQKQCLQSDDMVEVNVPRLAQLIVSNIIGRIVISKRMCDTFVNGMNLIDMFHITNDAITPAVSDFIPFLGGIADLKCRLKMNRVHKQIDRFWNVFLADRRRRMYELSNCEDAADTLDVLLSNHEVLEYGDDNLKAILMDILGAGTETTTITIEWAMAELLQNQHCLTKLEDFIMNQNAETSLSNHILYHAKSSSSCNPINDFGSSEPNIQTWKNDNYLVAVLKETLRLHPPVPLLIPRLSDSERCNVAGYTIEPNTILFVNAWAVGRDPEVWEQPQKFQPERFTNHTAKKLSNKEIFAFGAGCRKCPGMGLGLHIMEMTLAKLLEAFQWQLPKEASKLDMTEKTGSAGTHKAQPLHVVFIPRHTQKLL